MMSQTPPTVAEAERALAAVRAKRGFLLPHHGLLAITEPALLDAYDRMYTALTLTPRRLDEHRKEFIWLVILTVMREAIATHHIRKFREAGGSEAEIETAIALAGYAQSTPAFAFVEDSWKGHLPNFDRAAAYRARLGAVAGTTPPGLVEMAMAAAQACRDERWALAEHIKGAYAAGVPEAELAEAISLMMFPGSVPNFVEACGVWQRLVRDGAVPASEVFRTWAAMDQSGERPPR
jgi:alkylhydroperoxidase/carboxymuconolactone decarboxylase family protein YurZ